MARRKHLFGGQQNGKMAQLEADIAAWLRDNPGRAAPPRDLNRYTATIDEAETFDAERVVSILAALPPLDPVETLHVGGRLWFTRIAPLPPGNVAVHQMGATLLGFPVVQDDSRGPDAWWFEPNPPKKERP